MATEFVSATDTGRLRQVNEDAVEIDERYALAVLADGMGGHQAGELAAACAVSTIRRDLARWLGSSTSPPPESGLRAALHRSLAHANQKILETSRTQPDCAGMGSTAVVMVLCRTTVMIAHVGDSRAYRWRDGRLARLTKDHSLVQERLDAGLLTAEQATRSPDRHLLTRALGGDIDVTPDIHSHAIRRGDIVLMCSDGLTEMLADAEISQVLATHHDLPVACQALVAAANNAGGRDNIAVVLVRPDLS